MSKSIQTWVACLVALGGIAFGHASAADFTINVPVSLTNLPAASALKVYCGVQAGSINGTDVGSGSKRVVLTGGNFSGTVAVEFNAKPTQPPSSATDYSCYLGLEGKSAPKGTPFESSYQMLAKDWLGATGQSIAINPSNPTSVSGKLPVQK